MNKILSDIEIYNKISPKINHCITLSGKKKFDSLFEKGNEPHLVLEQAVEAKSAHTMPASQAHQKGHASLAEVLG